MAPVSSLTITHETFGDLTVYPYKEDIVFRASDVVKALGLTDMLQAVKNLTSSQNRVYIYRGTGFGENAILALTLDGVKELCSASSYKYADDFYTWAAIEPSERLKEKMSFNEAALAYDIEHCPAPPPSRHKKFQWEYGVVGALAAAIALILEHVLIVLMSP